DVEKLEDADGSFDAVVTRNVTWNLPYPEKAYKEWYRVLKPGGIFLNFDADWYGHLFDEKKRREYEQDRRQVEQQGFQDYYEGTDIERMEMIAREMPLSRETRPGWDLNIMEKVGFDGAVCSQEVWRQVWTEEEISNNRSTPIFLLEGRKRRENYILNNIQVQPGSSWNGYLELNHGEFCLPGAVFHGEKPGKTVLITAGVHAGEYVGIQAAIELAQKLDVSKVAGTIVIIKVMNVPAFEHRSGSMGFSDGKNLNRVFPGRPQGTEMERLAYAVAKELHPIADYYIDLHCGDNYEKLTPYVYYAGEAPEETVIRSRQMAQQVDVPYMVRSNVASGGSYNYAASKGIPSILIERGGMGAWNQEEVRSARMDVCNVLDYLGIYQEGKSQRRYDPAEVADVCYQNAKKGGLWYPFKKVGDSFRKGEILGEVRGYEGNVQEVSKGNYDGIVLYMTGSLQVVSNGPMIACGRLAAVGDERKERIIRYWKKRSSDFLVQRRAELYSPIADRWRREIQEQIPGDRKLKILHVGCGAGFFSILLAKEGHEVTGIDLTADMVENAKILAAEENAECSFYVMDAEKLDFEDESFDVVISRNLTWTLPDVRHAYEEWMRVLKHGGVLLNFDANYGLEDCRDTSGLPEKHAHNMVGREMAEECEAIKRQLPVSFRSRPAWDVEILSGMNIQKFEVDLGVSSRVYLEKDEFYNPTPMFRITSRKK
ncbi:MAG TPA: succinylglutamate desuccinylase/aspartoacylase family protein, partial [Candidatus Choladousia intestinigallinarum]|nr:succinylglutamate desuccinylase/aspartoacylase family protein [Candidatus Choladousia intestinigallinarum]